MTLVERSAVEVPIGADEAAGVSSKKDDDDCSKEIGDIESEDDD